MIENRKNRKPDPGLFFLSSETRTFTNVGTFPLNYDYNLAGELKTIAESTSQVDYTYDSAGRMASVSGAGLGVTQYATSMQYRAWGALKSMTHGNATSVSLGYNQRGLATHYAMNGVKAVGGGPVQPEGGDFQYYEDARVKFASDLRTDASMFGLHDRAYSYDQMARLKEAYSGYQARDFVNGTNSGIQDGAFRQTYGYDVWSNLTSRTGRFWSEDDNSTDSYNSQNRNPAWEYDPDGRLISNNEPAPDELPYQPLRFAFDASGRRVQSTQTTSRHSPVPNSPVIFTTAITKAEVYDGDGMLAKSARTTQLNTGSPVTVTSFFVRSSVLGGNTIAEYDSTGVRQNAYVFAGRELLAQQQRMIDGTTRLMWHHMNPLTGDGLNTDSQGVALNRTTVDPMGVNVGDTNPFANQGGGDPGDGEGMSQSAIDAMVAALVPGFGGPTCKVDGMVTGCRLAFGALSSGAAALLNPGANTTSRMVIYQGKSVLATYRATYDGYQGYMPINANYVGNGNFAPFSSGPPSLNTNTRHDSNFAMLNGAAGEAHLARSLQNVVPNANLRNREQAALDRGRVLLRRCFDFMRDLVTRAAAVTGQLNSITLQSAGGRPTTISNFDADSGLTAYQTAIDKGWVRSLGERPGYIMPAGAVGVTDSYTLLGSFKDVIGELSRRDVTWRHSF